MALQQTDYVLGHTTVEQQRQEETGHSRRAAKKLKPLFAPRASAQTKGVRGCFTLSDSDMDEQIDNPTTSMVVFLPIGTSVQSSSGSRVHHRSRQHSPTIRRDEHGRIRRILDSCRRLEKAGLRDVRNRLLLCDVQLACQKIHRVLNRTTVGVG